MAFPRRLLHDDEDVIVDLRAHWIRLIAPVVLGAVVLGAVIAGFVLWRRAPVWFGWFLLAIIAIDALLLGAKVVAWRSTNLIVASARVVYRRGVVRRYGREIPIERVQDVTYRQGLFERLLGAGSLTVESAGEGGSEAIGDVRHPEVVQGLINRAADASWRPVVPVSRTDAPNLVDQIERLDQLRRRGVITDHEFEIKKSELLGRL